MSFVMVLFALAALVAGGGALGVVLSRSLIRAAIWLMVSLLGVSLIFFLLGAEFVGAAQLIVYVGGTLVLVVFGVMLTNQGPFSGFQVRRPDWLVGGAIAVALFTAITTISLRAAKPTSDFADGPLPGAGPIGLAFLGVPEPGSSGHTYLLPFEAVSVHLLVVLVAAAYLARAKRRAIQPTEI